MSMCLLVVIDTKQFFKACCKDMLLQMADRLDIVLDGRSIELEHLDLSSYLSAPNRTM